MAQQAINDSLQILLSVHTKNDTSRIKLLNQLSRGYFTIDAPTAARYGNEALHLSDSLHYTTGKIWALRNLALVENTKGHLDQQMQLTLNALKLAETLGDSYTLGILNNDVGNIFTELNTPRDALVYLKKSLAIKIKRNEKQKSPKHSII